MTLYWSVCRRVVSLTKVFRKREFISSPVRVFLRWCELCGNLRTGWNNGKIRRWSRCSTRIVVWWQCHHPRRHADATPLARPVTFRGIIVGHSFSLEQFHIAHIDGG